MTMMWFGGGLMMVVFWGGLVALVVFLVRGAGARRSEGEEKRSRSDARKILAERFARGEISEESSSSGGECLSARPRSGTLPSVALVHSARTRTKEDVT